MLPDSLVLKGQELVENAKIQKFKWDILGNFQTMWTIWTLPCSKRQASCPCQTLLRIISLKGRQNIWQSSDDKPDLTFCPFHCSMTRMTLGFEKTKRAFKIVMKIDLYNMCLHCSTLMNYWYKTKTIFYTSPICFHFYKIEGI